MRLDVIDLSHWNDVRDWDAVAKAGVIGVIHKATEGMGYVDPNYAGRVEPAMAAGLKWGAYHFLQPGSDAEIDAQMAHFAEVVKPWDGMRLAIDYEASGLTLKHLRRACSTLSAHSSKPQVAIYGGSLLKGQLGDSTDGYLSTFALWLAHYSASPSWPKGTWPVITLHQYSDGSNGPNPKTVPGINSTCDCNQFNGSRENCAKWFDAGEARPETVSIRLRLGPGVLVADTASDLSLEPGEVIIEADDGAKVWISSM